MAILSLTRSNRVKYKMKLEPLQDVAQDGSYAEITDFSYTVTDPTGEEVPPGELAPIGSFVKMQSDSTVHPSSHYHVVVTVNSTFSAFGSVSTQSILSNVDNPTPVRVSLVIHKPVVVEKLIETAKWMVRLYLID